MSIDQITGGGTATRTIQIAKSIQNDFGIEWYRFKQSELSE